MAKTEINLCPSHGDQIVKEDALCLVTLRNILKENVGFYHEVCHRKKVQFSLCVIKFVLRLVFSLCNYLFSSDYFQEGKRSEKNKTNVTLLKYSGESAHFGLNLQGH